MAFIPENFSPPRGWTSPHMTLKILSTAFAAQDYECVMACADSIRGVFGPAHGWPSAEMTFTDNVADLERHAQEFEDRRAFAYAIFESQLPERYIGCLYIRQIKSKLENDGRKAMFDAQAFCWFSPLTAGESLVQIAFEEIVSWVNESWPFKSIAFPGRTIDWDQWEMLAVRGNQNSG